MLTEEKFKTRFMEKYATCFQTLHGKPISEGSLDQQYEALVETLREEIASNWVKTNAEYQARKVKQVYYFCIEYLPGRLLDNYLSNLEIKDPVKRGLAELGISLDDLEAQEKDVALGSGGLGRLASCLLDSLASTAIPGHGCGISYKYGLFQQKIVDGNQIEFPDRWISNYSAWQWPKRDKAMEVRFGGAVQMQQEGGSLKFIHTDYEAVLAVPYDMPIVGYDNNIVNTLRLWSAEVMPAAEEILLSNRQEYKKAVEYKYAVESLSEVLYPDDSNYQGKRFRLKQQYFMVSAGIQSILRFYKKKYELALEDLPNYIAVHINDTHPALVVPELMRLLLDEEGLGWDAAWDIVTRVVSYTNHTIMPEALEKWPVDIVKELMPRVYMIIEEIDRRARIKLEAAYPGEWDKINSMAVVHDGQVFMANLAVFGSYSVNGVAYIHTEILKKDVLRNFYQYEPQKFNNKTNGIAHRRWLYNSNPELTDLISGRIGNGWIKHPDDLAHLMRYAKDEEFLEELAQVKQARKEILAKYIMNKLAVPVDTKSIFDVQIKRIHAYKRQLLNALHIFALYNAMKAGAAPPAPPRTFIFAGKAAPSYYLAKAIIKLINTLAETINNDAAIDRRLRVIFLENYNVSLAQIIVPAAEVSEQISTASKEASGTGNMKMMMNGAVTIGTLDGANVEIREKVGEDNFVLFGLRADEVLELNQNNTYSAYNTIADDPRLADTMDKLFGGALPIDQQSLMSIKNYIYAGNDEFYVMKDFESYRQAQIKVGELYQDRPKWLEMSTVNIAKSGFFSSDRTVQEYARDIWRAQSITRIDK
ncbi:MAG: glycogen/starch/alpha-glucan phosphorylase [Acidaminococcales bacterium]|jgi:starch phosphorylase|nr:glycogen/starch/alpha-glucan phosphorylase [Acidaminococcales bacterium]